MIDFLRYAAHAQGR